MQNAIGVNDLLVSLAAAGGCGDGYCIVTGKAQGQHTNGGCRCASDRMKMQRVAMALQRFLTANNLKVPR